MFQDAMDLTDTRLFELRTRLEAYAEARLSPSLETSTRMRAYVMNVAHRRASLVAADTTFDGAGASIAAASAEPSRAAGNGRRPAAAALLAACLAVAMLAGTVSATRAGGPLYATRIWIEMANLPADVVARTEAEINRLAARLEEAQQASTAGDGPATQAALAAYSTIVIEAGQESIGDPTASAAIEMTVSRHVVVLTLMAGSVPPTARAGIEQALSSSTKVLDELDGADKHDSRDRVVDAEVSGETGPGGTDSARPRPANGNSPGAAVEDKSGPGKDARETGLGARDHDAPPPGQLRPDGAGNKAPGDQPAKKPIRDPKPARPVKP